MEAVAAEFGRTGNTTERTTTVLRHGVKRRFCPCPHRISFADFGTARESCEVFLLRSAFETMHRKDLSIYNLSVSVYPIYPQCAGAEGQAEHLILVEAIQLHAQPAERVPVADNEDTLSSL